VGGGSRNRMWGEILASVLQQPLNYLVDGEFGPAFGASRLARLALSGESITDICKTPAIIYTQVPNSEWVGFYTRQLIRYRELYGILRDSFKNVEIYK
jgi:xylulokinase